MENQAEYKTKDRQFHGDYTSPDNSVGQGKRPEQYKSSAIMLGYTLGFIIVLIVVFGGYKIVECMIDIIKTWL